MQAADALHTILVVDDDPDIVEALAEALQDEGYGVLTARNGIEALEVLRGVGRPCLILLDLMMPLMNGHEFLERRRGDAVLRSIPVAIVTAGPSPDVRQLEGVPILPKPIEFCKLMALVGQHCKGVTS